MAAALEKEMLDLRKLETEIGKVDSMLQDYVLKKHENDMVVLEFNNLVEGSGVYKMIGPALIPQEVNEAKATVGKRLEFIEKEINRLSGLKQDFMKKIEEKQQTVLKLQQELQRQRK